MDFTWDLFWISRLGNKETSGNGKTYGPRPPRKNETYLKQYKRKKIPTIATHLESDYLVANNK